MPTQDELLLKLIYQEENEKALDEAAAKFEKLTDAEKELLKASQNTEKQNKSMVNGFADLKAGLDLVGNVGGKVIDFLKGAVDDTIKYAAEVRDLSRSIGASAEETSSFIQVADDVGVSVGTIETAFKAAIKNGIRPNIDTLAKLSDEYNAIQDPIQRSQFALDKFGKAGLDMAKILEQGGDAIRAAAKDAKDLGLTLSEEDVKAAREFEIQMDNMGDKLEAFKMGLAKGVIPKLNEFFDTLQRGIEVGGYLTQGVGSLDEKENELSRSIAQLTILYGENSLGVKVASEALREYLQLKQQVGMTEQEHATRTAMAEVRSIEEISAATQQASVITNAYGQIQASINDALTKNSAEQEANAKATVAAATAQAAYRTAIADAGTAAASAAQQFKSASDAQIKQALAQSQIDTLSKALKDGTISQEGYNKAVDQVLLRYDLATPKSIAVAEAQQKVNEAFLSGQLPLNDYVTSSDKIPKIASDGKVTLEELASLGIKPVTSAVNEQKTTVDQLGLAWDKIPKSVKTVYTIDVKGEPPTGGTSTPNVPRIPGYASGGAFTVPPGYPNDSYPMRVSSGERVIVQPQNSVTNNWNVNADQAGMALLLERQRMMNSMAFEARM